MASLNKNSQVSSFHFISVHLYVMVFLLISITSRFTAHGCHEEERRSLLNFKSSMYHPPYRIMMTWGEGRQHENCCQWHGIRCSNDSLHVISIELFLNDITGDIPSSISNLKHLYHLDLSSNNIQGSIPNSICEISSLEFLDLGHNNLTGTIPSCIYKLRHLSTFSILNNSIEGRVSLISLVNVLNLTTLYLSSNMNLTVVIDKHLNVYPNHKLESLWLTSTNLIGSPSFICNLTGLVWLKLDNTNLTGTIPSSCLYKHIHLHEIVLSNNMLSGAIPLPPKAKNLFRFDISNNKFSGKISIETGKRLSIAKITYLYGNELTGSIPFSIFPRKTEPAIHPSGVLDLSHNKFTGSIPTDIPRDSALTFLNLGYNNLTGIVPKELEFSKNLGILLLNDNSLDGTINFISAFSILAFLNLANNNFGGSIPTALGSLHWLKVLSLRSNKLSGAIPEEILGLQVLCIIDLSLNNLSGHIPTKLGNLSGLPIISDSCRSFRKYGNNQLSLITKGITVKLRRFYDYSSVLDLSCNSLDGNIPEEIGLIKAISSLNLSHNQFSNHIPETIGNLSALESLDLSSNRLSGHIPLSLTTIDTLAVLNLSSNKLSGRVPRGIHFDTLGLDGAAFTGNELLCGFPLEKFCKGDHNTSTSVANPSNRDEKDDQDDKEKLVLGASVALGFMGGFWGLFFILLLKKEKWWFPYWRIVNSIAVRITNYIQDY